MLLNTLFTNPISALSVILALVVTLSIHEAAHAAVAYRLGDPTARLAGRLTLNPLAHLDPIGTLLLLVAGFGWGKPVPVNPSHFRNPNRDELLVALAGPVSNLVTAALAGIIIRSFLVLLSAPLFTLISLIAFYNISLAIFNLIPLPPLDGSKILKNLLPDRTYESIEQLSLPLLIILVLAIQYVPIVTVILFGSAQRLFQIFTGLSLNL